MVVKNENQYIMLWNSFTDIESVSRLTPDELYMWCFLYTMRKYDDTIVVNIDLLEQLMPIQYYASRPTINKDRLRQVLIQLKNKKCINYDVKDEVILSKKNDHIALLITLQCWSNKDDRYIDDHFTGYEPVSYDTYFNVKDRINFYIWIAVKRYENLGGRNCSDDEWAILLGVSDSTARRRVDKMVNEGVIYKKSGRWESSEKQAKNTYNTVPFDKIDIKIEEIVEESKEDKIEIDWGNWKDKKAYLTEDDFYLYWKFRDHKQFADMCDKRLRLLEGKRDFTDWIVDSKARVEMDNRKEIREKILSDMTNGIVYKDSQDVISLNNKNIGDIVWDKVDKVYYFSDDGTLGTGEFKYLASTEGFMSEKQRKFTIEQYKKLIATGEKLTMDRVNILRDKAKGIG